MIIEKGVYCYPIINEDIRHKYTINSSKIDVLWHRNIIFNKPITHEQIRIFNYINEAQNNNNTRELGKLLADEVYAFLIMNDTPAYYIDTSNSPSLYNDIIQQLTYRNIDYSNFIYVKLTKKSVFNLIKQYDKNPFFIIDTYLPITVYNVEETLYELPESYGNVSAIDYQYKEYLKLKEIYEN
jgi:hypothetical protein